MKILYMHAKELKIEAGVAGKVPAERRKAEASMRSKLGDALPELTDSNRKTTAANALLAFVCVERNDERLALAEVKDDILRARALLGVAEIVVGAFGHLSRDAASAMLAKSIIDDLVEMLVLEFPVTKTFPFGWDKSLELRIPLHHYNVAFRSFEPQGTLWDSIADAYDRHMEASGHYKAQWKLVDRLVELGHICGTILDVCCGSGGVALRLGNSPRGLLLVGLDESEKMIQMARRRASGSRCPGMIHFTKGRAEEIGKIFGIGTFDTVLIFNALSYIDMQKVIGDVRALLRSDGKLIIAEEDPFLPGFIHNVNNAYREILEKVQHLSVSTVAKSITKSGFRTLDKVDTSIDGKHKLVALVFGK